MFLKELNAKLKKAESSMIQVLKVNIYLADLNDYKAMNEVFKGRFWEKPPERITVATSGGVPCASLIEMDCIADKKREKQKQSNFLGCTFDQSSIK